MRNNIQSVERALRLLQEVAAQGDWVGVRELARATGLKPPTAQNLLKTLTSCGFLEFSESTRRYRLGLAALRLAEAADSRSRLADFAREDVDRLSQEFGETVAVLTYDQGRAVVIDWREADHPLAATHPSRVITEPHPMASGQVLLAYQPREVQEAYAASMTLQGRNLPATPAELLALLGQVRERGYAETSDVRGSGIAAVSAPVLDGAGRLVMALAVSMPATRVTVAMRARMRERTIASARSMSERLGWRAETGER